MAAALKRPEGKSPTQQTRGVKPSYSVDETRLVPGDSKTRMK